MMNIATHIQWRKFSWKKGGKLYEFPKYLFSFCMLQLFAFKLKPQTFSRVCLRFITWRLPFETEVIQMRKYICQLECETQRFCCCNCHVLMQVLSILMRNIPAFWSRSLYRFSWSNDTRATNLLTIVSYKCILAQFWWFLNSQYTLNGKRRVSNSKCHVIKRKQTREKVCGLCLNANSCNMQNQNKYFGNS